MTGNDKSEAKGVSGLMHGQVCYLQIPARDVMASAAFYEKLFGWQIERPHASFEAPGLIGQWVSERAPAGDAGLVAWIQVNSIDEVLEMLGESGGEVVRPPTEDGTRWIASIRDPAGNVVGIVQQGPR